MANILSSFLGKSLVEKHLSERLESFRSLVIEQKSNLFNFMLFLRITPLVPNFVVNISCPHVGVPMRTFFWGTFFGVGFPSILLIRIGYNLDRLASSDAVKPALS